jgi:Ca-activated chloride channel homolog
MRGRIMTRKTFAALCLASLSALAGAQAAFITQVDSSSLLATQRNKLYARVLDAEGKAVQSPDPASISVYESADGKDYARASGVTVKAGSNKDQGIAFLFLVDNSGSMYDTASGQPAVDEKDTRGYAAKRAAETFLLSITGSRDTVGLAAFNTRYKLVVPPSRDRRKVALALDEISRPERQEGYTELYASLVEGSSDMRELVGRKALVVLSDGVNYPYAKYEKVPHPEYGGRMFAWGEALDEAVRDGVTVFAVNFGTEKDSLLADIALQSGGEVFDARNEEELSAAYQSIRDKILTEALVEYRAGMMGGDKRYVKLAYGAGGKVSSSERYYYAGTVFGQSGGPAPAWIFLAVPLALLAWLALSLVKFERPSLSANLSLLYAPGAGMGTKMFNVGDRTVIGADRTADITIAGDSALERSPVTIVKDPTTRKFTIMSTDAILVNNRRVTKKNLEPGDVINFNGTIAVFDDDEGAGPAGGSAKAGAKGEGKGRAAGRARPASRKK